MPQHDHQQWTDSFPWSLSYRWGHSALTVDFDLSGDAPRLLRVRRPDDPGPDPEETRSAPSLPLVDLVLPGDDTRRAGPRSIGTASGARLKYHAHHSTCGSGSDNAAAGESGSASGSVGRGRWHRLTFELHDPATGLTAFVEYASPDGVSVLRSRVRLRNDGAGQVTVRSLGSLLVGGLPSPDDLSVFRASDDRLAERRWYTEPLRSAVPDVDHVVRGGSGRAVARFAGRGSGPTGGHLATGALRHRTDGRCWLWQIESASGWVWEVGESAGGTYLALGGPTHDEHRWRQGLAPGAEFATDWAALALGDRLDGALAALAARR
ncbi:hypothetical protein [Streptomyces sp. MB09-02B]|uniref:hypothetical protein n=1 Tax=Streptomyces sp. MB09-02B TaxID=3028667 RepID=UPI0029AA224A|nr:hypothetical protein [Streptomyces sp. MB09-02B]MDX3645290.1 hypothetical protein [Streptomyces sp. MB09-02B]